MAAEEKWMGSGKIPLVFLCCEDPRSADIIWEANRPPHAVHGAPEARGDLLLAFMAAARVSPLATSLAGRREVRDEASGKTSILEEMTMWCFSLSSCCFLPSFVGRVSSISTF